MTLLATRKSEQNQALLDPWTVVHFGVGLALGLMEAPLVPVTAAAIGYEFLEQHIERAGWGQELFRTSGPETLGNAVVDVGVFVVGHYLGRRYNRG